MAEIETGGKTRRILLILVMIAFTALVVTRFTSAKNLVNTLIQGKWQWIVVAILTHLIYFVLYTLLYKFGFMTVEVDSRTSRLVPILFASIFVNAVIPTGGAGGAALFVDDAVQRGQSGARTAAGVVLVLVADLVTSIPFLIYGVVFLYFQKGLRFYDLIGALIFTLFVGILSAALLLARAKPDTLSEILKWVQGKINTLGGWFKHPNWISDKWVRESAGDFTAAAKAISEHPRLLGLTLGYGFFLHIVNLAGLYALFLAYEQPVRLGTLVAGFGMGIVFWVIAIVPQGVGAVEGIMTLVFTSMGIPETKAVVIALAFRGVSFWLPLVIGFFFLKKVRAFKDTSETGKDKDQEEEGSRQDAREKDLEAE